MPLQKLQFRPGVNREGTNYSNEGGWYDCDKVRFRSGQAEKIGGWVQLASATFLGVCRALWSWVDLTGQNKYIGVGTNLKYYIEKSSSYYDITPIRKTVNPMANNPFSTSFSTLAANLNATDTVLTLTSTASFANYPGVIRIETEQIRFGGVSGSTLINLTRGYNGTTAAPHVNGSAVGCSTITVTDAANGATPDDFVTFSGATGFFGGFSAVSAAFTATVSGAVLNVSAVASGGLFVGQTISGAGITVGTTIIALGTGTGNIGTYILSASYVIAAPTAMTGTSSGINAEQQIVNTITSLNQYTIVIPGVFSTALANGGGVAVVAVYQITTGLPIYQVGDGWGAGAWGSGGWGSASPTSTIGQQLLLWSNDNFGQDLLIAQRGGAIYYWQQSLGLGTRAVALQSLANTTTILTDASIFGSGATSITVTATNAPNIFPYMYITGSGIPANTKVSSTYITGSTTVPITGTTTSASSGTYNFSYAGDFVPSKTNQVVASAIQRFVIAFGANSYSPNDANTVFNPMLVRWSDQSNPYQWVPQLTNQSGEFLLTNGSYIMGARTTRQEILVWTDACLYSMQYLGPPYVWGFQVLMDNISVMSPNCMITVNNVTYWMGQEKFYSYSGRVETLPCSLRQYVFDNINKDQSYQIFAGANEGFNEIWWFYCSQDSTVVDSYVIYNYLDRVWYYGSMGRTAWLEVGINPQPVAADYNNRLLYHEVGTDDFSGSNAVAIDSYIQSSDFDIGDGHNFGFVWRILPDINFNGSNMDTQGATSPYPSVTMTVKPRQNSGTPYGAANNPIVNSQNNYALRHAYNVQLFDGQVYTRLRGRQMSFRIESTRIGVAWQLGVPRIDLRPDGRR